MREKILSVRPLETGKTTVEVDEERDYLLSRAMKYSDDMNIAARLSEEARREGLSGIAEELAKESEQCYACFVVLMQRLSAYLIDKGREE